MNARFKVSIAGKNAGRDQIVIAENLFDVWIERTRIADAGRATITDQIEAQLVEILPAGRSSPDTQLPRASPAPTSSSPPSAPSSHVRPLSSPTEPAASMTLGFEVFVQDVIAAIRDVAMTQINFRVRKLFRMNLDQAIGRGTVVDHFGLRPNAGALAASHRRLRPHRSTFQVVVRRRPPVIAWRSQPCRCA